MKEDTDKLHNQMLRSKQAESLLLNPLYEESFNLVESSLLKELTNTNYKEVELREELYRRIQLLRDIKSTLTKTIQTGKVAEDKLSKLERAKKLVGL